MWNPHYKSLDCWRGIAALWVMMFHGFGTSYQISLYPLAEGVKAIAAPGWLGVHFFFVISGYCIMASAYRLRLKEISTLTFLKNRFWRLVPTYWVAFISTIVLNVASSPFNQVSPGAMLPTSWQSWVGNLFLIQPYLHVPFYVVVYWSLAVEVGFYLIVAGLIWISRRFGLSLALFVGLTTGVISIFIDSQWAVLTTWCEFVCGALLFIALLSRAKGRVYPQNLSVSLIVIFVILGLWSTQTSHQSLVWFSGGFTLLLYLLYPLDDRLALIKPLSWLSFVGVMSYSLYLIHVPIQGRVINLGSRFIPADSVVFLILQILGWIVAFSASYIFLQIC